MLLTDQQQVHTAASGLPTPSLTRVALCPGTSLQDTPRAFLSSGGNYSCGPLTLFYIKHEDPMDCSLPGFSVHGIFQARVLEWVAISWLIACQVWHKPLNVCLFLNWYYHPHLLNTSFARICVLCFISCHLVVTPTPWFQYLHLRGNGSPEKLNSVLKFGRLMVRGAGIGTLL